MSKDLDSFDTFSIIEKISSSGECYKVSKDGSEYFAKITSVVVNDINKKQILDKAATYKSISYPSISPFSEVFEKDNQVGYTSPFYSSNSLKETLTNLNSTEKTITMYGFACALKNLKDKRIIPSNLNGLEKIVFDSDKRPILSGFYFSELDEVAYEDNNFFVPPEVSGSQSLKESSLSYIFGAYAFLIMNNKNSGDQVSRQPDMPNNFPDNFKNTLQQCLGTESSRPSIDELVNKFNDSSFLFSDVDSNKFKQYQNFLNINNTIPIAPSESPNQVSGLSTVDPLNDIKPPSDNVSVISSLIGSRAPSQRSQTSNVSSPVSPKAETAPTNFNSESIGPESQNSSRAPSQRSQMSNVSSPVSSKTAAIAAAALNVESNAQESQNSSRAPSQRSQMSNISSPVSSKTAAIAAAVLNAESNVSETQNLSRAPSQRSQSSKTAAIASAFINSESNAPETQNLSRAPSQRSQSSSVLSKTAAQSVDPTDFYEPQVNPEEQYVSPDYFPDNSFQPGPVDYANPYQMNVQNFGYVPVQQINQAPDLQSIISDAKSGNPDAMFCYGKMLYDGFSIPQNYHKAAYYFKQAGKRGNANSEFFYGMLLEKGQGVAQNLNKAVAHYCKSARLGSADGHYKYGLFLDRGICVEKSRTGATNHFKIAAEQNHPLAMYNYGFALAKGRGLPSQNQELGAYFVKRSADLGIAQAQNLFGYMLLKGIGISKDANLAYKYIKLAADQQYPPALNLYGEALITGKYASKDPQKALELFETASKLGDQSATNNIGRMYQLGLGMKKKNEEKAFDYYFKSAENGNLQALVNLATCYFEGSGVKKDLKKAASLYKFAADNNNVEAMIFTGICKENGFGTKENKKEAYTMYETAADKNNCAALYHKGRCLLQGIGVKKNKNEALKVLTSAANLGSDRASKLIKSNF